MPVQPFPEVNVIIQPIKLEFLALKWAVTESFQEYLCGKTFTLYSDNNHLTYILTTPKLDATGQRWIAKLAKFNFTVYSRWVPLKLDFWEHENLSDL